MFEIDRLTLNIDRQWNNFGVLVGPSVCRLLTLFDFGYSLGVLIPNSVPRYLVARKSRSQAVSKSFNKKCSLLPKFKFDIKDSYLLYLDNLDFPKAKLFRQQIRLHYRR